MVLPLDFRRHFISLIKTLAGTSALAARFTLEKPGYSPYVFSVEFNKIIDIDTRQREITARPPILVTISTGLFDVMTTFSNGAIAMKGRETVLGLYLKDIYLLPLKQIQTGEQEFRIAGHAVFRGVRHYVDGSDVRELEEAINTHLYKRYSFLIQQYHLDYHSCVSPVKVLGPPSYHKGVCFHYGGQLTTLQGRIHLKSTPETLQFLYDFGLGIRTGQGFGLLEVGD
ncbi:hypothetical protein MOLA_09970 [Moorella thermoacetica]|uniref:CRISPR-associated endoribonuclease Cas6 n=1 Tax=Neomoorella thermoacetica TaxID=1525 RepID=UPI0011E7FD00|nr:CRISPR-associated endoribonuclease Cas6 [Moorella thermoacetica]TYL10914.1 hypothetical protein MOLA_09970 [Moorella thermoacetica]